MHTKTVHWRLQFVDHRLEDTMEHLSHPEELISERRLLAIWTAMAIAAHVIFAGSMLLLSSLR